MMSGDYSNGAMLDGDVQSYSEEDAVIDAIADDADDAAFNAWGPSGRPLHRPNPHPDGSENAEHWDRFFWLAYGRYNH